MTYFILTLLVIAITSLLRLLVVGQIGLGDDEAHYWTYTEYMDLSYYDHPPLVAYLIKISTFIFGDNVFAVRLPSVLIFGVLCYLMYKIVKELYGEKIAFWTVVLLNVTPVFSFLGAVLTVPDVPLSLFWVLFIYISYKIVNPVRELRSLTNVDSSFRPPSTTASLYPRRESGTFSNGVKGAPKYNWYVLGALLGLGFLSKYNAVLLVPSFGLYLLLAGKLKGVLKQKEPYIALFISFVLTLPVIIWNMINNWASFGYQLGHGFGKSAPKFSFEMLGRCMGAQAGYISPFLFILSWVVLGILTYRVIKKKADDNEKFIFSFSFPTIIFFNAIASFNEILPHWPAMGYLMLSVSVAYYSVKWWNNKLLKVSVILSWGFAFLLTLIVPLQALFKIIPVDRIMDAKEAYKIEDGVKKAEKVDVTNELYGWDQAGERIIYMLEHELRPKTFVFTHRHYIASQLSFYIPKLPEIDPRAYCLSERIDAYDLWQRDLSALNGKDAIFVSDNRFFEDPEKIYPFKSFKELAPVEVYRKGRKIRVFYLTLCKNFDLSKLPPEYTADALGLKLTLKQSIINLDHKIFWIINKNHNLFLDILMRTMSFIGNGLPLGIIIGFIIWYYRRDKFIKEFIFAVLILLTGGIIVQILKNFVARVRPLTVFGDEVRVLGEKLFRTSFPSGHTQASFSAATYLALRFKKYWWISFIVALLVGISRIYIGAHFPIDVAAGAFVGLLTAYILVSILNKKKPL